MEGVVNYSLWLSVTLFTLGAFGVLVRRNLIVMFMCVELMLNAVNLAFVAFAKMWGQLDGQIFVFIVMAVAAAEAAVGLAIVVSVFRNYRSVLSSDLDLLRD